MANKPFFFIHYCETIAEST